MLLPPSDFPLFDAMMLIPFILSNCRECIRRCLSIKYLTCDEVIEYIREHKLYMGIEETDTRS
jgi:nicotinic acid mononucleotide adenylyltransferase